MTKESVGNPFKEKCVAAGLMNRSAHGLRKAAATVAAENGATEAELDGDLRVDRSPDGEPLHEEGEPQKTRPWRRCKARTND
jgi:hypothetical protein